MVVLHVVCPSGFGTPAELAAQLLRAGKVFVKHCLSISNVVKSGNLERNMCVMLCVINLFCGMFRMSVLQFLLDISQHTYRYCISVIWKTGLLKACPPFNT